MLENVGFTAAVTALTLLVVFLAWEMLVRRGRKRKRPVDPVAGLDEARLEAGERKASPIAEAIEERVKAILAGKGEAALVGVDFGTASDGSLEIWVGKERYTKVDEIPDERLRDAIRQAVEEFNR